MKQLLYLLPLLFLFACNQPLTEEDVLAKAKEIHDNVLTIDSHTGHTHVDDEGEFRYWRR